MKRFLKIVLFILLIPCLVLSGIILYATITDYQPADNVYIYKADNKVDTLPVHASLNLLTWNIGYAGLDDKMDFFYDGGKRVRTAETQLIENIRCINSTMMNSDSIDFKLFQEVDISSKRSYHINEVSLMQGVMSNSKSYFGKNYDVFFVPVPFLQPMGSVKSGILSFSRFTPSEVVRMSFPGQYAWPKRLFMLDRCFLVMRFAVSNGKQLLIINTHNEAYDAGNIRDQQMAFLKKFITDEFTKGNYVLVGGDWNQCPPSLQPHFSADVFDTIDFKGIPADFLPEGWNWAFDPTAPSNRRVDVTYTRGKTRTTVIDFYLLSPNLQSVYCKTTDLGFSCSDHQPVQIKINFKP